MGQDAQERQLEASSILTRLPHCFGTLRQHVIVCNECSKQFECLQKYNSHNA
jgi:hypothetical protein